HGNGANYSQRADCARRRAEVADGCACVPEVTVLKEIHMRNRFHVFILTLTVLTVGALFLGAQSRGTDKPDLRSAPPDLTGVWHPQGKSMDLAKLVVPGDQMLLTPYGEERLRTVDPSRDPSARCLPFGPVRAVCCLVHPNMIVQHSNVVA